eukprot:scaffold110694_cov66-Phaeocystis_antarctica.AAC.1
MLERAVADRAADASASCGSSDGGTTEPEEESETEQAAEPAPAPPTPALTTDRSPEGRSAAKPRACSACTLETEDAAQAKCEACGCELDPPSCGSATRRKTEAAAAVAAPSPHKKSILVSSQRS